MKSLKLATAALLAGVALSVAAAPDAKTPDTGERPERAYRMHGPSLEHMAMRNAMVEELSARTGRSAAEIVALFEQEDRRVAVQSLGLDREAMQEVRQNARQKVIERAAQAQLITAEQARTLAEAPPKHGRLHKGKFKDGTQKAPAAN